MNAATKPDWASPSEVPPTPSIRWKLRTRPLRLSGVLLWMMTLLSNIGRVSNRPSRNTAAIESRNQPESASTTSEAA